MLKKISKRNHFRIGVGKKKIYTRKLNSSDFSFQGGSLAMYSV